MTGNRGVGAEKAGAQRRTGAIEKFESRIGVYSGGAPIVPELPLPIAEPARHQTVRTVPTDEVARTRQIGNGRLFDRSAAAATARQLLPALASQKDNAQFGRAHL